MNQINRVQEEQKPNECEDVDVKDKISFFSKQKPEKEELPPRKASLKPKEKAQTHETHQEESQQ